MSLMSPSRQESLRSRENLGMSLATWQGDYVLTTPHCCPLHLHLCGLGGLVRVFSSPCVHLLCAPCLLVNFNSFGFGSSSSSCACQCQRQHRSRGAGDGRGGLGYPIQPDTAEVATSEFSIKLHSCILFIFISINFRPLSVQQFHSNLLMRASI